jgi:quercetin dioxygenase-like cupin family protein
MEKINEAEKEFRNKKSGPKYIFRGPRFEWGIIRFLPTEELGKHLHNETEETFYFTKGCPRMVVEDQEFRAVEGDAVRVEEKEAHNIINDTDDVVECVFMKVPYNPEDKVSL